jgi:hypothetical protein
MVRRLLAAALLALALAASGAWAKPPVLRGGHPGGGGSGGTVQACDGGSSVCAQFQNGQSFITWNDPDTGTAGDNWRAKVYRSLAPITSGNYGAATLIGNYILNNSAQLIGGDPTSPSTAPWTTTYRADGTRPRIALSDLGTQLPAHTGLMTHTATGTEDAYYAVVVFPTAGGSDTYIGSVGPIAESVGDQRPYKQYDSAAAGRNSVIWAWLMGPDEGHWQDGLMRALVVRQLNTTSFPAGSLNMRPRDTIWTPVGTAALETFWSGLGMTPLSYVGPANRRYLGTANGLEKMIGWAIGHYGADGNQVHHTGQSMGAMAVVTVAKMTSPRLASTWLLYPVWQMYLRSSGSWPGATWSGTWPFRATVAAAPNTLGTTATSVLLPDGSAWGGTGGYADLFATFADPNQDVPPIYFGANKNDTSILAPATVQFQHQLDALALLQTHKRGHAFVWAPGNHDIDPNAALDCDKGGGVAGICTSRAKFRLNLAYPAFANSSIDDDPGTATWNASNIMDGDPTGCVNCGFQWTIVADTASAFDFTVDNTFMDLSPTPVRQTTLVGSIPSSGTGSVTVTNGSVFVSTSGNPYFIVGGTEIIVVSSVSGNTVNYAARGRLDTTAQAHGAGETIRQYVSIPSGPNAGPFSTMSVDITPRRRQAFLPAESAIVSCTITPHGGSPGVQTPTVTGGLFTLVGVTINATGATSVACSP